MKKKIRFWLMPFLGALALAAGIAGTSVAADSVQVKIGDHGKFTRIVFEFPKLTAYHVKSSDGNVRIDFDAKSSVSLPAIKSGQISSIKAIPDGDGMLMIDIGVTSGADIKDYRLQKKIVVDVYSATAHAQAKTGANEKPSAPIPLQPVKIADEHESATPKPDVPAKEVAAGQIKAALAEAAAPAAPVTEQSPATAPAAVQTTENTAVAPPPVMLAPAPEKMTTAEQTTLSAADTPQNTAAPPEPPPAPAAVTAGSGDETDYKPPEEVTKITLSFLSPSRLAVFDRYDTLWLVTDATTVTTLPVITGPMAEFITPPKMLRFEGGTAYRYTFPKKFYPQVKKQNLAWEISLLTLAPPPPPPVDMNVVFDKNSHKAKMVLPLAGAGDTLVFEDPVIGDTLYVVPTNRDDQVVQNTRRLSDFEIVPALLGMVIRPLRDGLKANEGNDFIFLTAPGGLIVTPEGIGTPVLIGEADAASDNDNNRLFDFPNWRQGGHKMLQMRKKELQDKIVAAKTPDERAGLLMKMAMLYFSNNFGPEALGILQLVSDENPEMEKNPDFVAIRGAANAMSGHFKEALQDLSYAPIQNNPEVNLWIGYASAATEQWRMADRSFPRSNRLLLQYPDNIAIPFTIYMAESSLRLGHSDTAKKLLDTINMSSDALDPQYQAAISYLRGVTFSQDGKLDKAEETWRPVAKGLDRLYHTKAALALTRLQVQQKKISLKDAIDQIDNLRFAWRGDGLEVEILRTLGSLEVQNNQILAGLEDMKQAADLSDSILDDSTPIRDDMKRIFSDLFTGGQAGKISPLEAVSVYNEFNSLLPSGATRVAASLDFADYLIRMDLLGKAEDLIEEQISIGLPSEKTAGTGAKLAAVYLLDAHPDLALEALKKTDTGSAPDSEERMLLKARAQSKLNQADAAIGTLSSMTSRNAVRLRADVLWRAQNWSEAAKTIESLLPADSSASLSDEDAQLVVNAAVAWKLAGDTARLKDVKAKYGASMAATSMASTFGVVTRDGGSSDLADRESMLKISGEVDMFKSFLDTYKAASGKGS